MLRIRSWGAAVLLTGVFSGGLSLAQNLQPTGEGPATGTLKVRTSTVVEDVVVIGKRGRGITGLTKDDFQIFEDGKPQAITFFEANSVTATAQSQPVSLPPNTFSNVPTVQPNQAINVLLMDALNTGGGDQMYVRQQMVKYLSALPPTSE